MPANEASSKVNVFRVAFMLDKYTEIYFWPRFVAAVFY